MVSAGASAGITSRDGPLTRGQLRVAAATAEERQAKKLSMLLEVAQKLTGELADSIYVKILSFANFGFAESHALSFALLVYASSWFKLHYPAAFLAGLLRNQPMGFYSPQSLVGDARRHGVASSVSIVIASAPVCWSASLERYGNGVGSSAGLIG